MLGMWGTRRAGLGTRDLGGVQVGVRRRGKRGTRRSTLPAPGLARGTPLLHTSPGGAGRGKGAEGPGRGITA